MEHETEDFFSGVLKIALGIALGLGISWVAVSTYERYQLERAARTWNAEIHAAQEQSSHDKALQETRQRMAAVALKQQQEALTQEAIERAEAERLKEAAWQNFYQPAPKCQNPSSFDVSVECGNAHIRAKREFEAKWAARTI